MGQSRATWLGGIPKETITCQPHAGQICLPHHPQLIVLGALARPRSLPPLPLALLYLMLLAQVTVQGSDHSGLFPQRILIPQLSVIN